VSNKSWTKKQKISPNSSFSSHSGKPNKKSKAQPNTKMLDRSKKAISKKNKQGTLVITPGS
jgi:hypothetical protein